MLASQANRLVADLKRGLATGLPPYEDERVRQILAEISSLYELNEAAAKSVAAGRGSDAAGGNDADGQSEEERARQYNRVFHAILMRHSCMERNKRCLLAYLYQRLAQLRRLRWEFGPVLPADIRFNMKEEEASWLSTYNRSLAQYMDTVGFDLTASRQPPKTLFVEVRCLTDYGELETEDGSVVNLKRGSHHYLLRSDTEQLVRQGVLEHVANR